MKLPLRSRRPLVLLAATTLVLQASAQQSAIQDLGSLGTPINASRAEAHAITPDGQFIGGFSTFGGGSATRAFRWSAASGLLDLTPSIELFSVFGLSDDGTIAVGQARLPAVSNWQVACRWEASTGAVWLGTLGLGSSTSSVATETSGDGSTIVGYENHDLGAGETEQRAFVWTAAGGMAELGRLANYSGASSSALDVSSDGSIVVGVSNNTFGQLRAVSWTAAGAPQDLGVLSGNATDNSLAYGISNDGQVIVGASGNNQWPPSAANGMKPFRWTAATGMQALPLPAGKVGIATATNDDGSVIVGHYFDPIFTDPKFGFIWTAATGTLTLPTLGESTYPKAVSGDGSVVVGISTVSFSSRAFRWSTAGLETRYCAALPNSTGQTGHLAIYGDNIVARNNVQLVATQLPPNRLGYFIASRTQGNFLPFNSQGRLCLSQPIVRFASAGQVQNSGPSGSFSLSLNLPTFPSGPGSFGVVPGDTWNFQAWHRDVGGTASTNLTDAVSVEFH